MKARLRKIGRYLRNVGGFIAFAAAILWRVAMVYVGFGLSVLGKRTADLGARIAARNQIAFDLTLDRGP